MKRQGKLFQSKLSGTGYSTYSKAPADVKKLVDSLEFIDNYQDIQKVKKAIEKKGYSIELSMDGSIESLKKLPAKKVGYKSDRTNILRKTTPYIKKYLADGYSRKDAIKNATLDAAYMSGAKKNNKNQSKMNHKDTKSHNVNIRVLSGVDAIDFTRVNNDINGNPRYVIHFLDILNSEERSFLPFSKKYEYSVKKSKALGGKKFSNKQYGGGIVFSSYNLENLEKRLIDLKHSTPKIKY